MKISRKHVADTLAENMQRAALLWPQIVQSLMEIEEKNHFIEEETVNHVMTAFAEYYQTMLQEDPVVLAEQQLEWWQESAEMWQRQWSRFIQVPLDEKSETMAEDKPKDRRFRSELWEQNWFFDSIKKQYLLASQQMQKMLSHADKTLDPHTAHLVQFYARQWVDALSPSNYPWLNPEVLKEIIETDGENLVNGLENLLEDIRRGYISMTPPDAFKLGKDIAATPGKVVYENELMQLIQYEPATKTAYEIPLLIIPAWINKYYVLDLQKDNSLVRWLVGKGYTVFVISWVNPDSQHRDCDFDDYMTKGALRALEKVRQAVDGKPVHMVGYCLGGTLLSCLLAWLHAKKRQNEVASATYLTTLVDFVEAGDLKVFIDEPQIEALEKRMSEKGYLDGRDMALTFTLLRPVDLIWSFVVNNYLLGKDPVPFDLLYWNADATRMPAKMHSFYLRQMYLHNQLAQPDALTIAGEKINIGKIKTPSYLLATREDHIAPWKAVYAATQHYRGEVQFVLAASGHIAGVINSPARGKYGFWTGEKMPETPQEWLQDATEQMGSWWVHWEQWLQPQSGKKITAIKPGEGGLKVVEDAPGRYAQVRS